MRSKVMLIFLVFMIISVGFSLDKHTFTIKTNDPVNIAKFYFFNDTDGDLRYTRSFTSPTPKTIDGDDYYVFRLDNMDLLNDNYKLYVEVNGINVSFFENSAYQTYTYFDNSVVGIGGGYGVTNHSDLDGLDQNDHPQYVSDSGDTMTGNLTVNADINGQNIYSSAFYSNNFLYNNGSSCCGGGASLPCASCDNNDLNVSGYVNSSSGFFVNNTEVLTAEVDTLQSVTTRGATTTNEITVNARFHADTYLADTLNYTLTDDGSDMVMSVNVEGNNYFSVETEGTFFRLIANPNAAVDYEMVTFAETQGDDTNIVFYEEGTGHNRIWDSGSMRLGGDRNSLCSELTSVVDCDTSGTGADLVVQDDIWAGGKLYCTDWSNVTIDGNQVTDDGTYLLATGDTAIGNYTFNTNTLHIDSNGNVGIGTTTPLSDLHVKGAPSADGVLFIDTTNSDDTNSDAVISLFEAGNQRWSIFMDGDNAYNSLNFYDFTSASYAMSMYNGFIGINSTAPTYPLSVGVPTSTYGAIEVEQLDDQTATILGVDNDDAYISLYDDAQNVETYINSEGNTFFSAGGTGNVAIGHNNPTEKFHIQGTSPNILSKATNGGGSAYFYSIGNNAGNNGDFWQAGTDGSQNYIIRDFSGGGWSTDLLIDVDGDVGIADDTPSYRLDVNGGIACQGCASKSADSNLGIMSADGEIVIDTSSEKFKTSIVNKLVDCENYYKIAVIEFQNINETKRRLGVSAEQIFDLGLYSFLSFQPNNCTSFDLLCLREHVWTVDYAKLATVGMQCMGQKIQDLESELRAFRIRLVILENGLLE